MGDSQSATDRGFTESDDTEYVGQAIRRIRKQQGVSLQTLAANSGVAVGMLSQIERDLGNPSLKTLARIRQALNVPLSAFFDESTEQTSFRIGDLSPNIRRANHRKRMQFGEPMMSKEMLSPPAGKRLQFMVLDIEPGASSGPTALSYPAEKGGMVLQGSFELLLDGSALRLRQGDSFQFDGMTPHIFHNPFDEPASVLWIIAHDPPVHPNF